MLVDGYIIKNNELRKKVVISLLGELASMEVTGC